MHALPPHAVVPAEFPFPALTTLAGRLPLGGPREVALAALMGARLASDVSGDRALPEPVRRARATAARHWCSALALPPGIRHPTLRLIDATASNNRGEVREALDDLMTQVAPTLDPRARAELRRLHAALDA